VVFVQLLAALGIKGSDIAFRLRRLDDLEEQADGDLSVRRATRRGDAFPWLLTLSDNQKGPYRLLPIDPTRVETMALHPAKRGRVDKCIST